MEPSPFLATTARAFTLVEMLVVLAIIGILTVIVINGQQDFNKSLTITDTAYTVALSFREAQTFGLSSRTYSTSVTNAGYGVHFAASTPASYLLFADIANTGGVLSNCPVGTSGQPDAKPGNCRYDAASNEVVQTFTFNRGFTVSKFCGHDTGNTTICSTDVVNPLTGIDIVFLRPNTNSVVTGTRSASTIILKDAQITLAAPTGGSTRLICVTAVGEVSVASTTCP